MPVPRPLAGLQIKEGAWPRDGGTLYAPMGDREADILRGAPPFRATATTARTTRPPAPADPTRPIHQMLEFVTGQPVRPGLPSKAELEQVLAAPGPRLLRAHPAPPTPARPRASSPCMAQALPLEPTDWERVLNPDPSDVTLTWIGCGAPAPAAPPRARAPTARTRRGRHSSFLIQLGGVNLLCDPVFSSRASPVPFAGPWRCVPRAQRRPRAPPALLPSAPRR